MHKKMAWAMLIFVLITAPFAHLWWAKDEPQYILFLSELALGYPAVLAIWFADKEDRGD